MARRRTVEAPAAGKWETVARAVMATRREVDIPLNGRPAQAVRQALRYWLKPRGYALRARQEGGVLIVRAERAA